jgi:hypothetical protein
LKKNTEFLLRNWKKFKKSIEEAFNKEYYKGLKMNGKVFSLKPSKILLNPYGITAVIDTKATLKLTLTGI